MRPRSLFALLLASLVSALAARDAEACGAAYPGGPVMCDFPRRPERAGPGADAGRPVLRVGSAYAFTSTTLLFGDGRRADLTRHAVLGSVEAPLAPRVSLQAGAGGVLGGALTHGAARDTIGPGATGFFGVGARVYEGTRLLPFVQLTGTLSVTHMLTRADGVGTGGAPLPEGSPARPRYTALDVRAGAMAGKTFGGVLTPYAAARIFGGPIFWRLDGARVQGTDLYKYQLGGGLSVALVSRRVDLFVEGIALGERGVSAGLGTTFF